MYVCELKRIWAVFFPLFFFVVMGDDGGSSASGDSGANLSPQRGRARGEHNGVKAPEEYNEKNGHVVSMLCIHP